MRVTKHRTEVPVEGVEVRSCDISDARTVRDAMDGVEVVVHCAASMRALGDVGKLDAVNVTGTLNVMEGARDRGVEHVVHMSSTCVMDEYIDHSGTDETCPYPRVIRDQYTRSKVAAERIATSFAKELDLTIFRPGWVWGPRSQEMHTLCRLLEMGLLVIPGRGENLLHTVYVDNLSEAVALAIDRRATGTFIITDNDGTCVEGFLTRLRRGLGLSGIVPRLPFSLVYAAATLSEAVGRALGLELPTRLQACNLGRNHVFSNSSARRELGFAPMVGLDEGVERTVAWYRGVPG